MSKEQKPGWRDLFIIAFVLLALVLFKALVAGYVVVVHLVWEPESRWQWACLNAVLGGLSSALLTQNPAHAVFMIAACFIGGILLGGIVEPGMGFVDVFLWPWGG